MRGNYITDRKGNNNPNYKHGKRNTRLYRIYHNMKSRCLNQNSLFYHRYGGRGIEICEDWLNSFQSFYDWSITHNYGDNLTLDRINNDGNYEPNNCRWVNRRIQCVNRSNNHIVTINGMTKSLMEWCDFYNINYRTVQDRLKRGWSEEKALCEPVQTKFRKRVV